MPISQIRPEPTMDSAGSNIPDPMPWLRALAPADKLGALDAWERWLKCFVLHSNVTWSQTARTEVLTAYEAGRTARVPCGPPPALLCRDDAILGWFRWAAEESSTRFSDQSWKTHTFSWTHQMADSLGLTGAWRHPHLEAASMAVFLMVRLDFLHRTEGPSLPADTFSGRESTAAERQKQIWRECIRIRQYLADMLPLAQDLPRKSRGPFKVWWFSCLEWTRLAEREGIGLWDHPVSFSAVSRIHVRWQRLFGKMAFR